MSANFAIAVATDYSANSAIRHGPLGLVCSWSVELACIRTGGVGLRGGQSVGFRRSDVAAKGIPPVHRYRGAETDAFGSTVIGDRSPLGARVGRVW